MAAPGQSGAGGEGETTREIFFPCRDRCEAWRTADEPLLDHRLIVTGRWSTRPERRKETGRQFFCYYHPPAIVDCHQMDLGPARKVSCRPLMARFDPGGGLGCR